MMISLGACQGSVSGSPEGVPVALESIDGAPAKVQTALIDELATAASDRKVELVGSSAQARYRVRGYISTETTEGETKVAYVWDVFDAQKRRAKRLAGSSPVSVASGSISSIDKETLAKLAAASMDEIAEFLAASKSENPFQTAEVSGEETPVVLQ
jgi:sugar phosphate isomerase/epimerase